MVNNNGIPIEVKKPFETVYEIKDEYKVPSWEEFEKNYQEGNLNYDDLNGSNVGEVEGYGPCIPYNPNCTCTAEQLRAQIRSNRQFRVIMNTKEWYTASNIFPQITDGLLIDAHWYSDRENHGDIPGNWVEKTWGNFFGVNLARIGDWEATEIRLESIGMGKKALNHMDKGWLKIRLGKNIIGTISANTVQLFRNDEPTVYVKNRLREKIEEYENGQSIDANINFS